MDDEYRDLNRASLEERAPAHAASPDDNVQGFVDDPAYIGSVVQFDRARLGDLKGLRGVHLQCHFGTDTVGLSRLGARMTGLDFSPRLHRHRSTVLATEHLSLGRNGCGTAQAWRPVVHP